MTMHANRNRLIAIDLIAQCLLSLAIGTAMSIALAAMTLLLASSGGTP